jgi:hypothetical protein
MTVVAGWKNESSCDDECCGSKKVMRFEGVFPSDHQQSLLAALFVNIIDCLRCNSHPIYSLLLNEKKTVSTK